MLFVDFSGRRSSTASRRRFRSAACLAPFSPTTALRCSLPRLPRASSASASCTTRRCPTRPSKTANRNPSGDKSKGDCCPCSKASSNSRSGCSTPPARRGWKRNTSARNTPKFARVRSPDTCADPASDEREPQLRNALRRAFRTEGQPPFARADRRTSGGDRASSSRRARNLRHPHQNGDGGRAYHDGSFRLEPSAQDRSCPVRERPGLRLRRAPRERQLFRGPSGVGKTMLAQNVCLRESKVSTTMSSR